jgi:hypothetical protein
MVFYRAISSMDWLAYETALLSIRVRAIGSRLLVAWFAHTRLTQTRRTRAAILAFVVRAARRRDRIWKVTLALALSYWRRIAKGREVPTVYVALY